MVKRLPRIHVAIGVILIILVVLTLSGFCLVLPYIDRFRPQIVSILNRTFDADIQLQKIHGSWEFFGPTLDIEGIDGAIADKRLHLQRVTLTLDIWQSLLRRRWQFRDVIFYHLQLNLNTMLMVRDYQVSQINSYCFFNLFLHHFNDFILRDSQITFLTSSGKRIRLSVPQITWLNTPNRQYAEGKISFSSTGMQKGAINVWMNQKRFLDKWNIYLEAKDIDLKLWFGQLLQNNTSLQRAHCSFAAWFSINNGEIISADALFSRGLALWQDGAQQEHRLDVNQLALHLRKLQDIWKTDVTVFNIATDGKSWMPAALSVFWIPEKRHLFFPDQKSEIRVRSSGLAFERVTPLLSFISIVTPKFRAWWYALQPHGKLSLLALDIPLRNVGATRFQARWRDLSWKTWKLLPGANHLSGLAEGSLATGRLQLVLNDSTLPYQGIFRSPLLLSRASAIFHWSHNYQEGLILRGRNIDIKARSLWANGDFYFHKPMKGEPWLNVLAGFRLKDAADAWRYFPESLMGTRLVNYLTGALKGGQVDNATLMFVGAPSQFPFKNNDGQFEVWVPLHHAKYQFESGWPMLKRLNIDLDFVNDGLFIYAPKIALGKVLGCNMVATIPEYAKKKLLIDICISDIGTAIREYFIQTPINELLGKTLDELKISGMVHGNLHLDIPLNGQSVTASGNIAMKNNSLYIKPLRITLHRLNGSFYYNNGNLNSSPLEGQWYGQPVSINFTIRKKYSGFDINIGLKGDWALNKLPKTQDTVMKSVNGRVVWRSDIAITFPMKGKTRYEITVMSDLKKLSSSLPPPLNKSNWKPLMLAINIKGDMRSFLLSGHIGASNYFNSQWLLGRNVMLTLTRGAWADGGKVPALPVDKKLICSLPLLDGEKWLELIKASFLTTNTLSTVLLHLPHELTLRIPALRLGGQVWHNLLLTYSRVRSGSSRVTAQGTEINGVLTMNDNAPWHTNLDYLYYNPALATKNINTASFHTGQCLSNIDSFSGWPMLAISCRQCWIMGKNLGQVRINIRPQQDQLLLTGGMIDTENMRLTVEGSWLRKRCENRSSLKGLLEGKDISAVGDYIRMDTSLRKAPFNLNYDLNWRAVPWKPAIASLNGVLHSQLGKGKIKNIKISRAGRLLRIISFDALLRKLQFDFRDALGKGFYFDSIKGTAWLKDGNLQTENLLIDGLEADIAITGNLNFNHQLIDMEFIIAPEISAPFGVATAFVINPMAGAAVFAASKALAPLWNKLALIRCRINGRFDELQIQKVFH
ncbi:MAG: AsmA2 domain-containing protein YhdP [Sodalis sp. (in: enterobacteria)]